MYASITNVSPIAQSKKNLSVLTIHTLTAKILIYNPGQSGMRTPHARR